MLEISFTFLYYANEESDDIIGGSTKTVQHSIKIISRNITAVFFKPSTRTVHHKRNKMMPIILLCHCPDNSYAAVPVSIKTKIPRFYLKQGSSTRNNLMRRVKTIWEPCVPSKTLCPTLKGCKWGYLIFHRKRLEPRILPLPFCFFCDIHFCCQV